MSNVTLELTPSEALVLFEFLVRMDEKDTGLIEHPSEQKVLWLLEGRLEKQVPVLSPDYRQLLVSARAEVDGCL